jgi:hypothetical protein
MGIGTRAFAFALLLVPCAAHSQSEGLSVAGVVTDPIGAPLPGVVIKVHSYSGALAGTSVSDGSGRYRTTGLAAGTYTVVAALSGFNTATQNATLSAQHGAAIVHFTLSMRWASGDTITIDNRDPIVDVSATTAVTSYGPLMPLPPARNYRSSFVGGLAARR